MCIHWGNKLCVPQTSTIYLAYLMSIFSNIYVCSLMPYLSGAYIQYALRLKLRLSAVEADCFSERQLQ